MLKKQTIILSLIIVLVAGIVFFGLGWYLSYKGGQVNAALLQTYQNNGKVLNFTKLFIQKVLKAENEVSFGDRLELENAVRSINNKEILAQWKKFTECETEDQAQEEVKNLMDLLISKVTY